MLGEKIAEFTGKTTSRRVINQHHDHVGNHHPTMEISMEQSGKVFGVETHDVGTYEAILTPHNNLEGRGTGISMTKDGESVTWTATGIGRFTGKGAGVNWRGSIHYTTTSTKLARLNGQCFIFEYDVDDLGTTQGRVFEWK